MRILLKWVLFVIALVIAGFFTRLLGFDFEVDYSSFRAVIMLFIAAAILVFFNETIGTLLKLLTLPLNCLTFGLFSLVINAIVLLLVSHLIHFGFHVGGFWAALVASIFIAIVNGFLNQFVPNEPKEL